jgi:hypothetical protein
VKQVRTGELRLHGHALSCPLVGEHCIGADRWT